MTDISTWSKTDDTNNDALKSGMPEGMARTDVNNRGREHMGAIRRWYEDAEWVDLLTEDENDFTVQRVNATTFRVADGTGTDASSKFAVGSWCRVTGTGGTTVVVGRIVSLTYAPPNLDVVLDTIKNASTWADSDLPATTVTKVEMYISKSAREATFHTVGVVRGETPQQIPTIDQLSTVVTKDEGTGGGIDADLLDGLEASAFALAGGGGGGGGSASNLLINGDFNIWQRGTPIDSAVSAYAPNLNRRYAADRWMYLSQDIEQFGEAPGDIIKRFVLSKEDSTPWLGSDRPPPYRSCFQMLAINTDGPTDSNKAGILQIVESDSCASARQEGTVSLSFDARRHNVTNNSISIVRCAVLRWVGLPDGVKSPIEFFGNTYDAWGGGSESTNPTLNPNWSYLADGSSALYKEITVGTSWGRHTFEGLVVPDATDLDFTANLAAFIWIQDTSYAVSDFVQFAAVQLEVGSSATDYVYEPVADQVDKCQRYYWKTYDLDVRPGTVTSVGEVMHPSSSTTTIDFAGADCIIPITYNTKMFSTPEDYDASIGGTPSPFAPGTGLKGAATGSTDGDLFAQDIQAGERGCGIRISSDPSSEQVIAVHVEAESELGFREPPSDPGEGPP
jgi:hypothetical protein